MNLDDAKKLKEACSMALITSNWTKMTVRHLPPAGEGTQFMSNSANDVPNLIAKAIKLGGAGGGALVACNAYSVAGQPDKVIIVGTFTNQVGSTNPGGAACNNILVVIGKGGDGKPIFYSAYPVAAPPAAGLLGAI